MEILLNILSIIVCGWVIWDDFKNREVHLVSLVILMIIIFIERFFYLESDWLLLLKRGGVNLLILIFIFGVTYLYLMKVSKIKSPWVSHLGIGDLLFFVALVFISNTIPFILLFITMTFFSLIVGGSFQLMFKWKNVPYAGMSVIVLVIVLTMRTFNIQFEQYVQSLVAY